MIAARHRPALPGLFVALMTALSLLAGLALAALPHHVLATVLLLTIFVLTVMISPQAALVPLLVLAPLRALIASEVGQPLPLDVGQLLLLVWLFAWAGHHIARRRRLPRPAWSPVAIALLLFIVVAGLAGLNAASPGAWLREWLKWPAMLLIVVIVSSGMQGAAWRWPLRAILLAGAVNALVGLYQFFGGSGALHFLIGGRFFRAFGTFGQPNPLGGFLAMLLPLSICLILAALLRFMRGRSVASAATVVVHGLTGALLLAGLIATWSRGAWLACGAALLVVLLALPRRLTRGILLSGGALLLAFGLWSAGLLPASLSARLASATEDYLGWQDMRGAIISPENYPVVERLAHWQAALNMATARPWLGVGPGHYEVAYDQFRLINWPEPLGHAHNFWLNQLAETGAVGLAVYAGMWGCVFICTWRARSHPDAGRRLVVIGLLGAWTGIAVHSLFDNLFVNNAFLHVAFLLGILAVLHREARCFQRLPARANFR